MDKTKNTIWIFTFIILISSFAIDNTIIKLSCIIGSVVAIVGIIYKNATEITNLSKDNIKIKTLRNVVIMTLLFLFLIIFTICFTEISNKLSENIVLTIITIFFIYFGNISPKIPCNRYVGFRLPWTVNDEETWRYAHRLLGYLSFPAAIIMFLTGFYYNLKVGIFLGVFIIVVIPGILSYRFYKNLYKV